MAVRPRPVDGWGPLIRLETHRPCHVTDGEGKWRRGSVECWRAHRTLGWSALVAWTSAPGLAHHQWLWADQIRAAELEAPGLSWPAAPH